VPEESQGHALPVGKAIRSTASGPALAVPGRATGKPVAATDGIENPSKENLATVLKERNRLSRLKGVLDWADSIDENNWRDALAVWLRSGVRSKFAWDLEARVVMERIGAVGGEEAIAALAKSSRIYDAGNFRVRQGMAGWASTHPREAMDYYLKGGAEPGEARGGLMEGLAQSDMNLARELSEQVLENWRDEHLRSIMENMERNGEGREAVKAWIAKTVQEQKDPRYTGQLIATYAQRELELIQAGGGNTEIFDWLMTQQTFPGESHHVLGSAALTLGQSHPEEALNWLSNLQPGAIAPETRDESAAGIVMQWQAAKPGAADAWMKANPNHPLHATIQSILTQPPLPDADGTLQIDESLELLPQ
jgi:hypothetical protein